MAENNRKRGFAGMDPEKQKEIASKGGKAVSEGKGSNYMASIGRKGGMNSHGRKRNEEESGGESRGQEAA